MMFPPESGIYQFPCNIGGTEGRIGLGSPKYVFGYFESAYAMISCHSGAAIKPATDFTIGVLSLLPTQTPTATEGVYPITHASRVSSVVPVFTATSYPWNERGELRGYSGRRAGASESIADMSRAIFSGTTCEDWGA